MYRGGPERPTVAREPSGDFDCSGEQQQQPGSTDVDRSSPTLILEGDGLTVPFDLEVTNKYQKRPVFSFSRRLRNAYDQVGCTTKISW